MSAIETRSAPVPARPADRPWNTLAPIALALSLVTVIGGIVTGHVALAQIRTSGERGRGLAVAALVIGYTWVGAVVLYLLAVAALGAVALSQR